MTNAHPIHYAIPTDAFQHGNRVIILFRVRSDTSIRETGAIIKHCRELTPDGYVDAFMTGFHGTAEWKSSMYHPPWQLC